ncbi:MAG: 8-oxo-dGTP diphosphatase MutT [Candidatus Sumerlaeia bacterium]
MSADRQNVPLRIVSAAIIREDGRYLIAQRPPGDPYEGLWEFPGGKVRIGEDPRAALVRECAEELGCTVTVGDPFEVIYHDYEDFIILMIAFWAQVVEGVPLAVECARIAMVRPNELLEYEFLPADRGLVDKILQLAQIESTGAL